MGRARQRRCARNATVLGVICSSRCPRHLTRAVANEILAGIEADSEDIFPDAMSRQLYAQWTADHKTHRASVRGHVNRPRLNPAVAGRDFQAGTQVPQPEGQHYGLSGALMFPIRNLSNSR